MVDELKKISKMAIYRHIVGFPEQIEFSLNVSLGRLPKVSKVCVCGIGASSIAGDIMSDFADSSSEMPIPVIRGIELPMWIDSDSLVIVISYSGNTKETLCLYERAVERGCNIICITAGGELLKRCIENENILLKVPMKASSRGSLGYYLGFLAVIFEQMGICPSRTELMGMIEQLKELRDSLMKKKDNPALSIARSISNRVPVVYGLANMRSAAIRWKTQINENSKMIAFCGTIPEFNHNEILGWTEDSTSKNFIPVMLYDEGATEMMKIVTDTTMSMLRDKGLEVNEYRVNGKNSLEKNLKCIMVGDFVSLFLAYMGNVDPCSISAISQVKQRVDSADRPASAGE